MFHILLPFEISRLIKVNPNTSALLEGNHVLILTFDLDL